MVRPFPNRRWSHAYLAKKVTDRENARLHFHNGIIPMQERWTIIFYNQISSTQPRQRHTGLILSCTCPQSLWQKCYTFSRSSWVVIVSDCQGRNRSSPGFDHSILRHSGTWEAADEAVLNGVNILKIKKDTAWQTWKNNPADSCHRPVFTGPVDQCVICNTWS